MYTKIRLAANGETVVCRNRPDRFRAGYIVSASTAFATQFPKITIQLISSVVLQLHIRTDIGKMSM